MKNVLLLGYDGYIGHALTLRLLKEGYNVFGIDDLSRRKKVKYVMSSFSALPIESVNKRKDTFKQFGYFDSSECSISYLHDDFSDFRGVIKHLKPDVVVNLAQQPSAPFSHLNNFQMKSTTYNNIIGTLNVIQCVKEFCPNAHIVTVGSMGEYQVDINTDIAEGLFEFEYNGKKSKTSIFPRRPGSIYHACYSDDTEILTENGWKLFKDLNKNEKVATLNKEKNELEYQIPSNYFEYDFDGKLISLKNRSVDLLVTNNHNLFEHSNYKSDLRNWRLTEAKDKYRKSICIRRNVENWEGNDVEYFVLPSCEVQTTGSEVNGIKIEPEKHIPIEDWLNFFGWYITEGCLYKNVINISQQKEYNHKEIIESLSCFDRKVQTNRQYGVIKGFSIKHRQLAEYLEEFGLSDKKFIPKWMKNLSKPLLKILFDVMMKGDGHLDDNSKKIHGTYYTKSKQLANDFHEICLKLGYSASLHKTDRQEHEYCVYISDNKTTQIIMSESVMKNRKNNPWNKIDYNGKIYCVEVPNSIVMVRRNGKSVWCGNSKCSSTYLLDCACRFWDLRVIDIMQGVVYGNWTPEIEETDMDTRLDSDIAFGTVVNRFIVQSIIQHPLTVYGKGLHKRGFLALNDSIQCLMLAIMNKPKKGEYVTWNQLDEVFSMNEIANKVQSVAKDFAFYIHKKYIPTPRKEVVDDHYYNPITDKLTNLGFKQTRTIEDEAGYIFKKVIENDLVSNIEQLKDVVIPKTSW